MNTPLPNKGDMQDNEMTKEEWDAKWPEGMPDTYTRWVMCKPDERQLYWSRERGQAKAEWEKGQRYWKSLEDNVATVEDMSSAQRAAASIRSQPNSIYKGKAQPQTATGSLAGGIAPFWRDKLSPPLKHIHRWFTWCPTTLRLGGTDGQDMDRTYTKDEAQAWIEAWERREKEAAQPKPQEAEQRCPTCDAWWNADWSETTLGCETCSKHMDKPKPQEAGDFWVRGVAEDLIHDGYIFRPRITGCGVVILKGFQVGYADTKSEAQSLVEAHIAEQAANNPYDKSILEELENIVQGQPLFAGNTLSHTTARYCGEHGLASRDGHGDWIPTDKGMKVYQEHFPAKEEAAAKVERISALEKRVGELEEDTNKLDEILAKTMDRLEALEAKPEVSGEVPYAERLERMVAAIAAGPDECRNAGEAVAMAERALTAIDTHLATKPTPAPPACELVDQEHLLRKLSRMLNVCPQYDGRSNDEWAMSHAIIELVHAHLSASERGEGGS